MIIITKTSSKKALVAMGATTMLILILYTHQNKQKTKSLISCSVYMPHKQEVRKFDLTTVYITHKINRS